MTDRRTAPRKTNDSSIAQLRMARGMTQEQLAEKVGCSVQQISRWECGGRNPGYRSLTLLAAALECPIDSIVCKIQKT